MRYLAVTGRKPLISLAEIQALYDKNAKLVGKNLIFFDFLQDKSMLVPNIDRLGGIMKLGRYFGHNFAEIIPFLIKEYPAGKITFGISDYSKQKRAGFPLRKSMELKRVLTKLGRSVRIIDSKEAEISSATAHHNRLGRERGHFEFLLVKGEIFLSLGTQDITAYTNRDQARPARDAKVGMLPPKLAQTLINLCGPLPAGSKVLDPFCGTGVVLQEAIIMGYSPLGSDINERMVEYTRWNLAWLFNPQNQRRFKLDASKLETIRDNISIADATRYKWKQPINAVVFEGFLGSPMSIMPAEIKLKTEKTRCKEIILEFLKNINPQIEPGTPIVMAIPAWLREGEYYDRLNILDVITRMGYNLEKFRGLKQSDLLYYREGQVVAREIIVLRKK